MKSRKLYSLLIFSLVFLMSVGALANTKSTGGFLIRPAGMYWSESYNDGGQETGSTAIKTTKTRVDFSGTVGYLMDIGFFIGGTYFNSNETEKTEVGSASAAEIKRTYTAYGPTIGLMGDMFYLMGTYHLSPTYLSGTDAQKFTLSDGTGYQIDLGVTFWVHSQIGIGPQFTYYNASYTKQKTHAGVESNLPATANHSFIRPMLVFTFMF